jgi:hypothetical protein
MFEARYFIGKLMRIIIKLQLNLRESIPKQEILLGQPLILPLHNINRVLNGHKLTIILIHKLLPPQHFHFPVLTFLLHDQPGQINLILNLLFNI